MKRNNTETLLCNELLKKIRPQKLSQILKKGVKKFTKALKEPG